MHDDMSLGDEGDVGAAKALCHTAGSEGRNICCKICTGACLVIVLCNFLILSVGCQTA